MTRTFEWADHWTGRKQTIEYDDTVAARPVFGYGQGETWTPMPVDEEFGFLENREASIHHRFDQALRAGGEYTLTNADRTVLARIDWILVHHPGIRETAC